MINPKLVKKFKLKIRLIDTFVSHHLGISIINKDFIKLKTWVKFWVKILGIY